MYGSTKNYDTTSFRSEEYTISISIPPKDESTLHTSATAVSASSSIDNNQFEEVTSEWEPINEDSSKFQTSNARLATTIFRLLGFEANPIDPSRSGTNNTRNTAASDMRLSMLSNFSTAYNIISISLALHMMDATYEHASPQQKSLCSSALIAGMILGQLAGGTLGDVLGRHKAMTFVMILQVSASFLSSLSFEYNADDSSRFGIPSFSVYSSLALWRFILGVGCGGVYPLAATLTAESSGSPEDRGKLVALTFSMQGVGYLVVPITAYGLVLIFGESSDLGWRLLLFFGCLPGGILTAIRVQRLYQQKKKIKKKSLASQHQGVLTKDVKRGIQHEQHPTLRAPPATVLESIWLEENLYTKLLGTGGCWLLFDILFYGNSLFQPIVLGAAFGDEETVLKVARDTSIIAAIALPGYIVSIVQFGRQSPRYIQMQGFLIMSILYGFIGYFFEDLASHRWILLSLYGSTFFFSNYGPNSTTYMLPSMTFSRSCRSTLNGVCAACGKVGALLGTLLFVSAADRYGDDFVMLCCAGMSMVGLFITHVCVSKNVGLDTPEKDTFSPSVTKEHRTLLEEQREKVELKVVYSAPSLFDMIESEQ